MKYKNKVRQLEKQTGYKTAGTDLQDLLRPGYKHKGKPYSSLDEMYEALNVIELPPYLTEAEIIRLYENNLLTSDSPEMENIRIETVKQMTAKL